jgi:uncharacterized protein (DUF779 family)
MCRWVPALPHYTFISRLQFAYWESGRVLVVVTGRGEMLTTGEVITTNENTVQA